MVEKPTVVAWMDETSAWRGPNAPTAPGTYALMDVAQHERIVAGLEADAARYRWLRNEAADAPNGTPTVVFGAGMDKILEGPWLDAAIDKAVGDAFLAQTAEGVES